MSNRPTRAHKDVELWFQDLCCGGCQAARLMHWIREYDEHRISGANDRPQHAVVLSSHYAVVHCDYFRRRVEQPDKLTHCAARRSG